MALKALSDGVDIILGLRHNSTIIDYQSRLCE